MPGVVYPFVHDLVNRRLPEGGRVLEVGCGAMKYKPLLHGEYTGLDLPGSWHLEQPPDLAASAEQIPADDASFDVVFGVATFYYMDDVRKAFSECRRVLRPGGHLILFDYQRETIQKLVDEGDHLVRHIWDPAELRGKLADAGFSRSGMRDLSHRASEEGDPPLARRPVRWLKHRLRPGWTQWQIVEARR
jgi:SAM-dependent methyltransferase